MTGLQPRTSTALRWTALTAACTVVLLALLGSTRAAEDPLADQMMENFGEASALLETILGEVSEYYALQGLPFSLALLFGDNATETMSTGPPVET
mmetsp:Transcript_34336/g.97274  ORF Transcript_34336/g.97274 Transcript_34336/m.97274 type:complete len:95 (+) Transcript_34336:265-549(+)|eukprot:CAMPEP_0117668736 /NCGR_PEP_ID=MMETSP0804-20121206/11722_1 /TAXON_ID=1074897 /ORGANISM="Tetraselmis astigmatica, Strain CCMP880" /LENGTH=94 /DNA_ID=CAMNT_0005476675 /DNA_START=259 /DNA_END=543 /DNA_ORIENTATION=+